MTVFIDASVFLRQLLREPDPLPEWKAIRQAYASRLLVVEVGRVIDRLRLGGQIDDADVALLHGHVRKLLRSINVVALSEPILVAAARPMPTALGTLDSLHLATALALAPTLDQPLVLATHDLALGRAARASGLEVVGA